MYLKDSEIPPQVNFWTEEMISERSVFKQWKKLKPNFYGEACQRELI